MIPNTVETLLMLDPETFPVDGEWNEQEIATRLRKFAGQLTQFADALGAQEEPVVPTKPAARGKAKRVRKTVTPLQEQPATPRAKRGDPVESPNYFSRRGTRSKKVATKPAPKEKKVVVVKAQVVAKDQAKEPFTLDSVVGCFVAKKFEDEFYRGQVRSIDETTGEPLFFIDYTDGDQEEMTLKELCGALLAFAHQERQKDFAGLDKRTWLSKDGLVSAKKDSKRMATALEEFAAKADSGVKNPAKEPEFEAPEDSEDVEMKVDSTEEEPEAEEPEDSEDAEYEEDSKEKEPEVEAPEDSADDELEEDSIEKESEVAMVGDSAKPSEGSPNGETAANGLSADVLIAGAAKSDDAPNAEATIAAHAIEASSAIPIADEEKTAEKVTIKATDELKKSEIMVSVKRSAVASIETPNNSTAGGKVSGHGTATGMSEAAHSEVSATTEKVAAVPQAPDDALNGSPPSEIDMNDASAIAEYATGGPAEESPSKRRRVVP